jgi:hypothetical protein
LSTTTATNVQTNMLKVTSCVELRMMSNRFCYVCVLISFGLDQRNSDRILCLRFEVFTAMTMKNAVSSVVAKCSSCVKQRFGGS